MLFCRHLRTSAASWLTATHGRIVNVSSLSPNGWGKPNGPTTRLGKSCRKRKSLRSECKPAWTAQNGGSDGRGWQRRQCCAAKLDCASLQANPLPYLSRAYTTDASSTLYAHISSTRNAPHEPRPATRQHFAPTWIDSICRFPISGASAISIYQTSLRTPAKGAIHHNHCAPFATSTSRCAGCGP